MDEEENETGEDENETGGDGPVFDPNELNDVGGGEESDPPAPPDFIGGFGLGYIAGRPVRPGPSGDRFFDSINYTGPSRAPYYVDDDKFGIHDQWDLFAGASPQFISGVKVDLVNAGYLDADDIAPGQWTKWDRDDASAMKKIMETANGTNRTWQQVLGAEASGAHERRVKGDRNKGGGTRPTIRLESREDLRAAFRQTARSLAGGVFVDEDQIEGMVDSYQQKQEAYQRALMRGGTVEAPASAQTFAEGQIEELDPGSATANRFAEMTSVLDGMLQ